MCSKHSNSDYQNQSSKPSPSPKRDQLTAESENDYNHDSQRDNIGQNDDSVTPVTNYCPPPKGISEAMWERFQLLRERKQKLSSEQHSRQRGQKRKQKKQSGDDTATSNDSVQHDSKQLTPADPNPAKLLSRETTGCVDAGHQDSDPRLSWVNVKPFLGVNDHLKGVAQGRHAAKTKLELKIDQAISLQDFDTAEKLSDDLATREFGKEVADAFTAKRYAEKKTKEDSMMKAKKTRKLDWGFDHKQRWETKGNM